jgi:hypothetical protein
MGDDCSGSNRTVERLSKALRHSQPTSSTPVRSLPAAGTPPDHLISSDFFVFSRVGRVPITFLVALAMISPESPT